MIEFLEQTFHMTFSLIILFGFLWLLAILSAVQLYIISHMFISYLYRKFHLKWSFSTKWFTSKDRNFLIIGISFENFVMLYPRRDEDGYTPRTWKRIHWHGRWTPFCVLSHNTDPLCKRWRHPTHNVN